MSGLVLTILLISALVIFAPTGNGLKCWYCSTSQNDNCINPTRNSTTLRTDNCRSIFNPKAKFVCRTVEYYITAERKWHISRSCSEEKDQSNYEACSKQLLVAFPKVRSCNTCTTDLCNSAAMSTPGAP